jgi:hypothetical protein
MYNLMALTDGTLRHAMLLEPHDVSTPLEVKVFSGRGASALNREC